MPHDAHLPGYSIRRPLGPAELLPAVGVGIAAGLAAFYVAKVLLERTPLLPPEDRTRRARELQRASGRPVRHLGGQMVGDLDDDGDGVALERDLDEVLEDEDSFDDLGLAARVREARGSR